MQVKFNNFLLPNELSSKNCSIESRQAFGTFTLNKPCLEINEIEIIISKEFTPNSDFLIQKNISGRYS